MERTPRPVRQMTASEIGISVAVPDERSTAVPELSMEEAAETDPVFALVRDAIEDGYGAVVLVGPPGTGKSYYAQKIGSTVAGDPSRIRFTQFHPSYQYEDFVEGWTPTPDGGFVRTEKHFCLACAEAKKDPAHTYVIVIDELSRCDAARVFGEALTYIEITKRGKTFSLPSGNTMMVPPNLFIIATMNPWDRGVDEVDTALLRRFAQISMYPDPQVIETNLQGVGLDPNVVAGIVGFLEELLKSKDDRVHIGHAYFNNVKDNNSLRRLWPFQLLPLFKQATRSDNEAFAQIERSWRRLVVAALDKSEAPIDTNVDQSTAATTPNESPP